jgi:hypothetical protein
MQNHWILRRVFLHIILLLKVLHASAEQKGYHDGNQWGWLIFIQVRLEDKAQWTIQVGLE